MVREAKDSQNSKRKVENKIQRLIFSVSSWDE